MHKHHTKLAIMSYALLALAFPIIWSPAQAGAQVSGCPAGYTCTPVQQVTGCPANFVCTPTATSNTSNGQTFTNGYYYGSGNGYTSSGSSYASPTTNPNSQGSVSTNVQTISPAVACQTFLQPLGLGARSNDVANLQTFLINRGFSILNVQQGWVAPGYFGYQTAKALAAYQASVGLSQTGALDSATIARINASCSSTTNTTPTISSVTPSSASAQTVVTIYGNNLSGASSIDFRNANNQYAGSLTPSSSNASSVTFIMSGVFVANLPAGMYQISVATGACKGGCNSNSLSFTITSSGTNSTSQAPVISTLSASSAIPGATLTINGSNFVSGMAVIVTGKAFYKVVTPVSLSSTQIVFTLPPASEGYAYGTVHTVQVGSSNGNSNIASIVITDPSSGSGSTPTTSTSPLSVTCSGSPVPSLLNTANWTAVPAGGKAPYSYSWSMYNDVARYVDGAGTSATYSVQYGTAGTKQAVVRITDATGATLSATCSANTSPTVTTQTSTTATPLSATCSGSATNSGTPTVSWSSNVNGGTGPYTYSWSAYSDVMGYTGGSTSGNAFTGTYASYGAKQAVVRITDSVNGSYTATCSATIPQYTGNTTQTNTNPPTTSFTLSSNTVTLGQSVTLNSYTSSPSASLKSAAIDLSTDNMNWSSGSPCGYWNSPTGFESSHIVTCSFTPSVAGTYYLRSRGTDAVGTSQFVYQTLTVNPYSNPNADSTGSNGIAWVSVPQSVVAGQQFTVTMQNIGTRTWGTNHNLGISDPDLSKNLNYQFVGIGPTGMLVKKTVTMTAPATPGTYVLRAVQQGVEWFGVNQTFTVTSQ